MDRTKTAGCSSSVEFLVPSTFMFVILTRFRVINILRQMITDVNVLEREDMSILDRINEFAQMAVKDITAAQQLVNLIERTVRGFPVYAVL